MTYARSLAHVFKSVAERQLLDLCRCLEADGLMVEVRDGVFEFTESGRKVVKSRGVKYETPDADGCAVRPKCLC